MYFKMDFNHIILSHKYRAIAKSQKPIFHRSLLENITILYNQQETANVDEINIPL